jgi:hypothetical protein
MDKDGGCWKPDGESGKCGLRVELANIVGGTRAKPGDFPYMALIGYGNITNSKGETIISYNCGGSLINKYYVLTAAHCMFNGLGRDDAVLPSEVVLGEYNIRTDPDCNKKGDKCSLPKITRKITSQDQIIVHEHYVASAEDDTLVNDIALIRLNEPVPLNSESPTESSVMPICLPWAKDDFARQPLEGTNVTISGWGKVASNIADLTRKQILGVSAAFLQRADVPINNKFCEEDESYKKFFDANVTLCLRGLLFKGGFYYQSDSLSRATIRGRLLFKGGTCICDFTVA